MFECEKCGELFENVKLKANHIRWKHGQDYSIQGKENLKKKAYKLNEKRFGKWIEETVICFHCGAKIKIKYRFGKKKEKYFCSRSCSNSRNMKDLFSDDVKKKISDKIKDLWQEQSFVEKVNLGKNIRFTSKREVEIRDYFIKNFPNDEWTFGGNLKLEDISCSRDLYSNKLKICFEYDGIWHFKDIHGQLERKKRKDILLEDWCSKNKYKLVRVDSEENLSLEDIEKLIYRDKRKTIKIGKRY